MKKSRFLLLLAGIAGFALTGKAARADFPLKSGDRVVFFGDSITEERNYTRPFQDYVLARYPERHIHFYNAGWSGDQLGGAINRMQRDVLSRQPTVVTVCFGMNDGHYAKPNEATANNYRKNLETVVKRLTDNKIRVIIFSPSPVDEAMQPPWLKFPLKEVEYNKTLAQFGVICSEVAKKYGATYIDIMPPILKTLAILQTKDPNYKLLRDGVHPEEKGGVVMSGAMLLGLGAEPMPYLADVTAAQLTGPDKSQVPMAESIPVPFWMSAESAEAAQALGFFDVAAERLRVRGLAPGRYEVKVGDDLAGLWSAAELDKGVLFSGGFSSRAKRVYDMTNRKEDNYFNLWRVVNLDPEQGPATDGAVAGLLKADEGFQDALDSFNTPLKGVAITVRATGLPDNVGANLALKKPYVVSDPNTFNYGYGGLTDGSWSVEGGSHTFATGNQDTFPKTATIDLGSVQPITDVLTGVPNFGSTKTMIVSVSADNATFKEVGRYVFSPKKEERHLFAFDKTPARYIRLSYSDHYPDEYGYTATFAFTSEAEVYGPTN